MRIVNPNTGRAYMVLKERAHDGDLTTVLNRKGVGVIIE
jgi:hypothetical protein